MSNLCRWVGYGYIMEPATGIKVGSLIYVCIKLATFSQMAA